jgi:predicted phosphodiesterase
MGDSDTTDYEKLNAAIEKDRRKGVRLFSGEVVHQIPITRTPSGLMVFGLLGDTHLASKYTNEAALDAFYKQLKAEGVEHAFHAGDMMDGVLVFPGQAYTQYAVSVEDQAKYVEENYPLAGNIQTHFITGNHEEKAFQKVGVDMGKLVKRDDIEYLGAPNYARVNLGSINSPTLLDLVHLAGGVPYTIGYSQQKYVRNIPPKKRADIYGMGHTHNRNYSHHDGVDSLLVGGWQEPNSFSSRMGSGSEIGGWLISLKTDKKGRIEEITPKFLSYK